MSPITPAPIRTSDDVALANFHQIAIVGNQDNKLSPAFKIVILSANKESAPFTFTQDFKMPWSFALPQAVFASPLLAVGTPIVGGTAVALLTNRNSTRDTYRQLRQPPFSPPGWLFAPAWTILYGLMGYASHHATTVAHESLSLAARDANATAQTLYTTQLALNFMWMPLFFGVGRPAAALGDMALLIGNVSLLLANWWSADRTAFWLMTPYYAWLGYACYLNAGTGYLNGWTLPGKKRSE